jgi:hypothetical protein
MLPRDWRARIASRRIDRRLAGSGLLGAALLALLGETEPAEARLRRGKAKSKKQSRRTQSVKERTRRTPRFCGGIAGIPCPDGFTCIDDPGDDCDPKQGGADCGGICVRRVKDVCATVRCRKGTHCCPDCGRRVCVPDSVSCKEACTSTPCNEATCSPGEYCCNESCSRCSKLGQGCTREICPPKEPEGEFCGGIAGIPCPEGFICVDDPRDDCDPKTGGADCGGICVRKDGQPCGRTRCGPGEYCCNPSCGVCAPEGGACAAIVCEPEPGGERCGKTICPRGQVCCNASCGICTPPHAACIMIACVDEIAG